ncbi:MAG TPA: hypothetical protein PLY35_09470 [Thermotogota bacterium]|nr:hypothetical protein [Thermotogota bacterium]
MNAKLEQSEVDLIQEIKTDMSRLTYLIGDVELNKILTQSNLEKLEAEYKKLHKEFLMVKQKEADFLAKLQTKYGRGTIDVESYEFIKL